MTMPAAILYTVEALILADDLTMTEKQGKDNLALFNQREIT